MRRRRRTERSYKFTEKKHSVPGAVALVLSFVPLLLFFYAVTVSWNSAGQAAPFIGCVGIASVLLAGATLVVSVREARKETVYKRVPFCGTALSALILAVWLAVYVLGWMQ